MTRFRSLSSHLIFFCILGSMLAFFTTPITVQIPFSYFFGGDHRLALEVWTTKRARAIVIDSLHRQSDGTLAIEFTPALRAHLAANPNFRYAVFDFRSGRLAAGSSEELASHFQQVFVQAEVFGSLFHLLGDADPHSRGYIRTTETKLGRLATIVYGCQFHWDDILFQLHAYAAPENFVSYLLLALVLSLVAWIVVRSGLAPLREAAATIAAIDVNDLHHRASTANVPSEVVPFVDAVNAAFDRLRQGVARQKRFTANSAHELRTPIAILRGRIETLGESPLKRDIERDVKRIQTILEQLLVLAQIEQRDGCLSPPEINLQEVLLDTTADYLPLALAADRHVALEAPEEPVMIPAYRWAVESVAMNLIENAVRAEPKGGTVLIKLTDGAVIEVVDHGEGVAKEHREMIFEPFWRKSEISPGTGLGLAIAKELITKLNGRIWVEDTPGGGATFKIALPKIRRVARKTPHEMSGV
ncbi:sensor histidine kinase [Methylocystis bryophila]|uniref:histidine kinase n=1 Tax=Methylocystis bryophila TaxID=655015 RepID=A0A1W6MX42_9HYPH|nr:HAMP domain-containing sensor histidine kinase [Methylocystis bryophila]ARN82079.1 two-component sensor histidine kinase [Methylocystis bryophila]BDV38206.1 two-component sensor histidine kinase [Methylocystis bryophila]